MIPKLTIDGGLRLEGEVIRDSMLAAGGLLDTTMFGKGTLDAKGAAACHGCHTQVKDSGFVFSKLRD